LTPFAERVTRLAESEELDVFGFAPDGVELAAGQIQGHRWLGPDRGWTAVRTEFPDVLWNRYFPRDQDELMGALQAEGVPFINNSSLDKWEACRCLAAHGGPISEHLPQTRLLTDARVALEMLEQHAVVYIKPVCGSIGRGIIRMERESPRTMRLTYVSRDTDRLRQVYATEEQLTRWVVSRQRTGRFIVQQGLALAVVDGRPADVRVLVQKDAAARWHVTGMGARLAGHGRFTANLHTGGEGIPVAVLAEVVAPESRARQAALIAELERLALQTAQAAEQCAGPLGEIGLDLGVDQRGRTWYIELNGQPGRAIFEHLGRWDLAELAHLRPIQYARRLAGRKTARVAGHTAT
ncbi:MAG: yheD 5, partial [Firmicutes bacterium]|nr:yheD 5 [Bacillota bacterium]